MSDFVRPSCGYGQGSVCQRRRGLTKLDGQEAAISNRQLHRRNMDV